jgi:transposase
VIDESGLLMAPLVRRTWAERGQTPKLAQRRGKREEVSVAAAVWLSPLRDRMGLFARTRVDDYFDNWSSAAFLEALLQELPGRVVVVWDGGSRHKGDPIDQLQDLMTDRLSLEKFPPYSPQLCPVEPLWSGLKDSRLCNYAPQEATQLKGRVLAELSAIQDDRELLRGFWHASDLPLPRPPTLLS